MKNYTITVNGNVYDVTVEENGAGAPAAAPVAAPRAAAPAAPAAAPKAAAGAGSKSQGPDRSGAAGQGSTGRPAGALPESCGQSELPEGSGGAVCEKAEGQCGGPGAAGKG